MPLNTEQAAAHAAISKSITSEKNWLHFLVGCAGSGKTYTLAAIINDFPDESWMLLAPSHSARITMIDALRKQEVDINNIEIMTVQKFLGVQPNRKMARPLDVLKEEFYMNRRKRPANDIMGSHRIIVIDEISMVPQSMVKEFMELKRGGHTNAIFCGDYNQIPPVNEQGSLAFFEQVKAKRPERVQQLVFNVRADRETDIDVMANMALTEGVLGVKTGKGVTVYSHEDDWLAEYKRYVKDKKVPYAIAWTNNRVNSLNELARGVYGETLGFRGGDFVRVDTGELVGWTKKRGDFTIAYNGEYVTLDNAEDPEHFRLPWLVSTVKVQKVTVEEAEFYACGRDEFTAKDSDLRAHLEELADLCEKAVKWLDSNYGPNNPNVLTMLKKKRVGKAVRLLLTDVAGVLNGYKGDFRKARALIWGRCFFGHREKFVCLNHQYASTSHKSQGQSRPHVFVDSKSMTKNMLYVATSRAQNTLHVFRNN